ncbi:hypothetical protein AKO1_002502 [Acrasis kona]|uniref:Uncharacterized protein n=1 Tax=Acrasis kona TaxID=1008807 RepID=A0AAW2YV60_9EUKA
MAGRTKQATPKKTTNISFHGNKKGSSSGNYIPSGQKTPPTQQTASEMTPENYKEFLEFMSKKKTAVDVGQPQVPEEGHCKDKKRKSRSEEDVEEEEEEEEEEEDKKFEQPPKRKKCYWKANNKHIMSATKEESDEIDRLLENNNKKLPKVPKQPEVTLKDFGDNLRLDIKSLIEQEFVKLRTELQTPQASKKLKTEKSEQEEKPIPLTAGERKVVHQAVSIAYPTDERLAVPVPEDVLNDKKFDVAMRASITYCIAHTNAFGKLPELSNLTEHWAELKRHMRKGYLDINKESAIAKRLTAEKGQFLQEVVDGIISEKPYNSEEEKKIAKQNLIKRGMEVFKKKTAEKTKINEDNVVNVNE